MNLLASKQKKKLRKNVSKTCKIKLLSLLSVCFFFFFNFSSITFLHAYRAYNTHEHTEIDVWLQRRNDSIKFRLIIFLFFILHFLVSARRLRGNTSFCAYTQDKLSRIARGKAL